MVEWISLVNGKCPFNGNHRLEQYNKYLLYCLRCDLILQEEKDKKNLKNKIFHFGIRVGMKNARISVTEKNRKFHFHIFSLAFFPKISIKIIKLRGKKVGQ